MIYNSEYPLLPESKLRVTLNRLDACLTVCTQGMREELGFQLMCGALNEEFFGLVSELEALSASYKSQMPRFREEPLDMDWQSISKQISVHMDRLCSHAWYGKSESAYITADSQPKEATLSVVPYYPALLRMRLQRITELLDEIDDTLNSYSDGEMYAEYCKSELDYYDKTLFNGPKREINKKLNMQKSDKFVQYCQSERQKMVDELRSINEDFANESGIIDPEAIGRYIWGKHNNHEDDPVKKDGQPYTICDIMLMVKSADHYESRANGTAVRITDANMLKVQEYIAQMLQYATPQWKLLHQKLWTYLLANKGLIPCFTYKLNSRAEFNSFDLPFVHNVICTLQKEFHVYVPFDNKSGNPSVKKVNESLKYIGKGDVGAHRSALGKAIEDEGIMALVREIVGTVQSATVNC